MAKTIQRKKEEAARFDVSHAYGSGSGDNTKQARKDSSALWDDDECRQLRNKASKWRKDRQSKRERWQAVA